VPNLTSKLVAPAAVHDSDTLWETAVAPDTGTGSVGMLGGGTGGTPTVTLSNVAGLSCVVSWLTTTSPIVAAAAIVVVVVPVVTHAAPSGATAAVTVPPRRVSFSHAGAAWVPPAMNVVAPPATARFMNSIDPFGRTSRTTCADPAVRVSRSITPAFAYMLVFCKLATRATISTSPLVGCETIRNASAVPQMSAPLPATVNTPFQYVLLPARPVDPMSPPFHGVGSPVGAGTVVNDDIGPIVEPPAFFAVTCQK